MKLTATVLTTGLTSTMLMLSGCAGESNGPETGSPPATVDASDDHGHPSHGPHLGDLIELGDEEYHGELLHDEDIGMVTVYILDGSATEEVAIEATEIMVNATHDGEPAQFALAADPVADDAEGKSSRFVSRDKELSALLDEEGAEATLVLTIDGKSYRGPLVHDHGHDHGDHSHE